MRSFFHDALQTVGAYIFEFLTWSLSHFSVKWRYRITSRLGALFGLLAVNMRAALEGNMRVLFEMENEQLGPATQTIFRNFGMTLCDFFLPDQVHVHVPDRAKLEKIREQHPGIVLLTFHMGHWELGARTMQKWGWPVTAVYQPYRNKRFKRSIESRRAPGVNFIPVGGQAANGVRAALRRGDVVAMLGDLPFGEDGAKVNLFGHQVLWPKGPVVLAMRERCPIVVAVVVRTGRGEYTAFIEDPIIPEGRGKAEVQKMVQDVADKFGKFLPQYASQWYRFRRFEFVTDDQPVNRISSNRATGKHTKNETTQSASSRSSDRYAR